MLALTLALTACTKDAADDTSSTDDTAVVFVLEGQFTPTDALADHPTQGAVPHKLIDVAFDADGERHWSVEDLRAGVSEAQDWADANNPGFQEGDPELFFTDPWSPYHFWPSLIDLSSLHAQDAALYGTVLDALLVLDPDAASIRTATDAAIADGHRIWAARDFSSQSAGEDGRGFYEVHYGFLVDLDARQVQQLRVHAQSNLALEEHTDDHVDALQAIFDAPPASPEPEIWTMCLREDHRPDKWSTVIIDFWPDADGELQFWLQRTHLYCNGSVPWVPIDLDDPTPEEKPPERGDPPGGDGAGQGKRAGQGAAGAPRPPVRDQVGDDDPWPWPWEEESIELPEDAENTGASAPCGPDCASEADKARDLIEQLQGEADAMEGSINDDIDRLNDMNKGIKPDQEFNNQEVQRLYEQYLADILAAEQALEDVAAEGTALGDDCEDANATLTPGAKAHLNAGNLWAQLLYVGGTWTQVWVPITYPLIPGGGTAGSGLAGTEAIVFDDTMANYVQKAIAQMMIDGMSFDDAEKKILDDPGAYGGDPDKASDPVWRQVMKSYTTALEDLYIKMWRTSFETPSESWGPLTDDDIDNIIQVLLTGKLTAEADTQSLAAWTVKNDAAVAEGERLNDARKEYELERERLYLEFRAAAQEVLKQAKEDRLVVLNEIEILSHFLKICAGEAAPGSWSAFGTNAMICAALADLLSGVNQQDCPTLWAWLNGISGDNGCN